MTFFVLEGPCSSVGWRRTWGVCVSPSLCVSIEQAGQRPAVGSFQKAARGAGKAYQIYWGTKIRWSGTVLGMVATS